ncbi:hypothetical protein J4E80_001109 [Alternaria sp. BMP 0032]|nr:hypothetical protein J4E80_001109 [Alternaria sp. BMP 0032]
MAGYLIAPDVVSDSEFVSAMIHLSNISILIPYSALLSVNRKEMNEKLDAAQLRNDITTTSQHAALNDIKDGMKTANMNIEAGTSMLIKVSEALKFDWIRQLGCEIKGKMQSVMVINFAIYEAIIRLQESLPRYLERGISEELITLEDPIGRVAPFSLQWITSWDAFHSALDLRFQDMPGQRKMRRRQYALQASGTGREIVLSRPWHAAFRPGQRIEMSFIFNQDAAGESNITTCPGCHTQSNYSSDAEIECMKCQIRFRRITAIQHDELPLQATASSNNLPKKGPMVPLKAVITAEQEKGQEQGSYADSEHEEEDITSFKRVRIVSNRKRVGIHGNISPEKALPERSIDPRGLTNDDFEEMSGPLDGRFTDLRAQVDQFHEKVGRRAGEQGPKYAPAGLRIVRTVIKNMKERDRIKAKLANETTPLTQRELELWRELNSASAVPHIEQTIHLGNHDQESKR